jgi:putative DNA methylase
MVIAEVLKQRRVTARMTIRALAKELGVNAAHLLRVERGEKMPSADLLLRFASVVHCDADELLLLAGYLPSFIQHAASIDSIGVINHLRQLPISPKVEGIEDLTSVIDESKASIEIDFPFEWVSSLAESESWRKEVFRPTYHIHKWWAQRLGSVFRAILLSATQPAGKSIESVYYSKAAPQNLVVFDPFMGSGTTIGEALKLGMTAIGRDINPIAYRLVHAALLLDSADKIEEYFAHLQRNAAQKIRRFYKSKDSNGDECDVLYYFWVAIAKCPKCNNITELFPNFIFGRHAYPKKHPEAKIFCPNCENVFDGRYDTDNATCPACGWKFNPQIGNTSRTNCHCKTCNENFVIAKAVRLSGPQHKMYAKLVLRKDGRKEYLRITDEDRALFADAEAEFRKLQPKLPKLKIPNGHNTRQILNYGYHYWHQLYNPRQLLCLSLLANEIAQLPNDASREALSVLFSGILEFNNMFASHKGEGTGAVRHMFSHHILKPERLPLEANPWGTPKSSGAFSTLYKSRLLRAVEYAKNPFEIMPDGDGVTKKVFGLSLQPRVIYNSYPENGLGRCAAYISCGDSAATDIPSEVVDLVVTDPPFFDNVHYSELADFFHASGLLFFGSTQRSILKSLDTTRHLYEVQDVNEHSFSNKLCRVFCECERVLKKDGLLVFTYHHSRDAGWRSIAHAVKSAGFTFVQSYPVKAEMSGASPKASAKEPIDIDMILVCRKEKRDSRRKLPVSEACRIAAKNHKEKVDRYLSGKRKLSKTDIRLIKIAELLVHLSPKRSAAELCQALDECLHVMEEYAR